MTHLATKKFAGRAKSWFVFWFHFVDPIPGEGHANDAGQRCLAKARRAMKPKRLLPTKAKYGNEFFEGTDIDISECEVKVSDQLIIGKIPERFFYKTLWPLVNWALGVVELLVIHRSCMFFTFSLGPSCWMKSKPRSKSSASCS